MKTTQDEQGRSNTARQE